MPDFARLIYVHEKARKAGVSYGLNFNESDGSFYVNIDSPAPSERWIGKDHSFDLAIECACEWLDTLINKKQEKKKI